MPTRIGRPPRTVQPRRPVGIRHPVGIYDLLAAVADLGPNWPARFGGHEIADVRQAVDREKRAGNLLDGATLSPQGWQLLTRRRPDRRR